MAVVRNQISDFFLFSICYLFKIKQALKRLLISLFRLPRWFAWSAADLMKALAQLSKAQNREYFLESTKVFDFYVFYFLFGN